jgi:hypothetical protein
MARSSLVSEKMTIIFNVRHRGESFIRKIPLWVHELGHDDGPNSGDEEAVLHAATAMAWAQVLTASPGLAYENTELTRYLNSYLLVFLNSRNKDSPTSQIVAPNGTDTAPGSAKSTTDFRAFIEGASGSTPLPPVVGDILSGLGLADTSEYNTVLLESYQHLNDHWIDDKQRVQISVLLQLVTPSEIASTTGLSEQEVIDTLELQPYVEAIA